MIADIQTGQPSGDLVRGLPIDALPTSANGWPLRPFQIVSLREVLFPIAFVFVRDVIRLEKLRRCVYDLTRENKGQSFVDQQHGLRDELAALIKMLNLHCDRMQLTRTRQRLESTRMNTLSVKEAISVTTVAELEWELRELHDAIDIDLTSQLFCILEKDEVEYFNHPDFKPPTPPLFGVKVDRNFKSARHDVAEAGNCYAFARYTACVFHCMRVLEKGLHAFVNHLNKKHTAAINFGKKVEEEQWGRITDEIQIALESPKRLKRLNPVPTKDEIRFYASAAKEFEYFNHAWRKDVSHSRMSYDKTSAKSVMEHVENFMQILADNKLRE